MSTTKHTSFIPMSPDFLPRQKLNEVVTLPKLPEGLAPKVDLDEPLQRDRPRASPRKLTFICSVEWSWSPMHHRIDNYYLNPRRSGWLLWNNWVEDGGFPWTWHWDLIAHGNRCRSDAKNIACHLILELWKFDAKYNQVEQYHWINNTGLLSTEEIQAIAREVW